jgi:GNAT superfamily N-acetyltransferase
MGELRDRIGAPELRRAAKWRSRLIRNGEEDLDWDWSMLVEDVRRDNRAGYAKYVGIALWALRDLQGLMILEVSGRAYPRRADGAPQVYVAHLTVAPHNRRRIRDPRKLEGCGSALVERAAEESRSRGWEGRVSLHALPGAVDFYRNQGFEDLGPDPADGGYRYFERSDNVKRS